MNTKLFSTQGAALLVRSFFFVVALLMMNTNTAKAQVFKIEAESGTRSGVVAITNNNDHSGGAYVGSLGNGSANTATYTFNAPRAGVYSMKIHYMTAEDREMYVQVNGEAKTNQTYTNTGGWYGAANVRVHTLTVNINEGENTLVLGNDNAGAYAPNVDYFELAISTISTDFPYQLRFTNIAAANLNSVYINDQGVGSNVLLQNGDEFKSLWDIEFVDPAGTDHQHHLDFRLKSALGNYLKGSDQAGRQGDSRYTTTNIPDEATLFRFQQAANGAVMIARKSSRNANPEGTGEYQVFCLNPPGSVDIGKEVSEWNHADGGDFLEVVALYPQPNTQYRIRFTDGVTTGGNMVNNNHLYDNGNGANVILAGNSRNLMNLDWTLVPAGGDTYRLQSVLGHYLNYNGANFVASSTDATAFTLVSDAEANIQLRFQSEGITYYLSKNGDALQANATADAAANYVLFLYEPWQHTTEYSDKSITHRPSYLFEKAREVNSNGEWPDGFLKGEGDGMWMNGTTPIQQTSTYEITRYVPAGQDITLYLPPTMGNRLTDRAYQRWYDYSTDGKLTDGLLDLGRTIWGYQFQNGFVTGTNVLNYSEQVEDEADGLSKGRMSESWNFHAPENIKAMLPAGSAGYDLALDMSRYSDWSIEDNGNLREPSLTMRAIWHIRPASEISDRLQTAKTNHDADATADNAWLEGIKTIHFPESGLFRDERLPLEHDLNNYYFPDNSNAGREGGYNIVLNANGTGITLGGNNGLYVYDGINFARSRFIDFVYPGENKTVTATGEGNKATIEFYGKAADNTEYPIVKYIIIFDQGSNTNYYATWEGLDADGRSPQALRKKAGEPIASITFDTPAGAANYTTPAVDQHGTITPYKDYDDYRQIKSHKPAGTSDNAFLSSLLPLDFVHTSYAFDMGNCDWGHYSLMGQYKPGTDTYLNPIGVNGAGSNTENYSILHDGMSPHLFWVDASECPGNVASVSFEGTFCSGSKLMCTGWMACDNSKTDGSREPGSIILKIRGVKGGQNIDLHAFCPGQVSREGRAPSRVATADNGHVWQQFYFEFTINEPCDSYWLDIENNCVSTNGGDYLLDDIDVYAIVPISEVNMQTPLCINTEETGELRLLQVQSPFAGLLASVGQNRAADSGSSVDEKITFAYLHKEKFLDKYTTELKTRLGESTYATYLGGRTLEAAIDAGIFDFEGYTSGSDKEKMYEAYKVAFDYALVGTKTNDVATSVWKDSAPTENMGCAFAEFTWPTYYESVTPFSLATALSDSNKGNDDSSKSYIYRTTEGQEAYVFNGQVSGIEWPDYGNYYLLTYNSSISNIGDIYNDFNMCSPCMNLTKFTISTSLRVLGVETAESENAETYCAGKYPTIRTDIQVFDTSGASINLDGVHFDWWVGNNTTHAKLSNYWSRDNGLTGDARITLAEALSYFRVSYPTKANFEGVVPNASLTQGMIDFLKDLVDAGELYLYKIAIDEVQIKAQETVDGTSFYYLVACPIAEDVTAKVNEKNNSVTPATSYAVWCNAPQGLAIIVQEQAPSVKSGYDTDGAVTYNYQEAAGETKLLSIRLAKRSQFDILRHGTDVAVPDATQPNLFLPLRAAEAPNTDRVIENAEDRNIYLSTTNDPTWDATIRNSMEAAVPSLPIVGKIVRLFALDGSDTSDNLNAANYLQIHFTADFNAKEGFNYRLKLPYKEGGTSTNQCEGDLLIDLKIVPDYQVWTGAAGNTDWNNDLNWRRADQVDLKLATANYEPKSATGKSIAAPTLDAVVYPANDAAQVENNNGVGFAPLEVTRILMMTGESATAVDAPNLYDVTPTGTDGDNFPNLNATTSTDILKYDFIARDWTSVAANQANLDKHGGKTGDLVAIMYKANICREIVFQPRTELMNAHRLTYDKAWVEYELEKNDWHLLSSPLQGMISGEWYAPTGSARQETTYFEPVTFDIGSYDRYSPAVYQRGWDKAKAVLYESGAVWNRNDNEQNPNDPANLGTVEPGTWTVDPNDQNVFTFNTTGADEYLQRITYKPFGSNKANVAIKGTWSNVFNDHTVSYDDGGFSVMVINNLKGESAENAAKTAIFRLPKEDTFYDIWNWDQNSADEKRTTVDLAANGLAQNRGRLRSDAFAANASDNLYVTLRNEGGANLGKFLASNPFVCGLDMEKFFDANASLNKQFTLLNNEGQQVYSYNTTASRWELNGVAATPVVKPGEAFFIDVAAGATNRDEVSVSFTTAMMTSAFAPVNDQTGNAAPARFTVTANRGQWTSTAVVETNQEVSNQFVENEDVATFIDENILACPTVYTQCGRLATTVNRLHDFRCLPLGIESNSDEEALLTFNGVELLGDSVALYDAVDNTLTPLADGMQLAVPGRTQNRYFLVNGLSLREAAEESSLQVYAEGRRVTVVATNERPLRAVNCYDTAGRMVYRAQVNGLSRHEFQLPKAGIYVVEATTENSRKTQKIMTK